MLFQSITTKDFFASTFRISAIELQIFDTQPLFGHFAIIFGNWLATRTFLLFCLAFLADLVKLHASIPLPFSRSWVISAYLTNQSLGQIFNKRSHSTRFCELDYSRLEDSTRRAAAKWPALFCDSVFVDFVYFSNFPGNLNTVFTFIFFSFVFREFVYFLNFPGKFSVVTFHFLVLREFVYFLTFPFSLKNSEFWLFRIFLVNLSQNKCVWLRLHRWDIFDSFRTACTVFLVYIMGSSC